MNGNKKRLNTIIALSLTVLGIIAGVTLINKPQNINEKAAASTSLFLTPNIQEVNLGKSFSTIVTVDPGDNKITGIDLELNFNPSVMHIDEVKPTSELINFNTVIKNEIDNTDGIIRYAAFTFDKNLAISGKLGLLTITGSIPNNGTQGTFKIEFSDSSIVVATGEGQNVISNISNAEIKIIGGVPNSCGGTCGSNNNCQANYFCFEGYCRNPVCPSDNSCNCTVSQTATPTTKATAKATVRPTARTTAKATAVPVKGGTETSGPMYSSSPKPTIEFKTTAPNTVTTDDLKNNVWSDFSKYIIGMLIFIAIAVLSFLGVKNYNKNKTHILPPTNI